MSLGYSGYNWPRQEFIKVTGKNKCCIYSKLSNYYILLYVLLTSRINYMNVQCCCTVFALLINEIFLMYSQPEIKKEFLILSTSFWNGTVTMRY